MNEKAATSFRTAKKAKEKTTPKNSQKRPENPKKEQRTPAKTLPGDAKRKVEVTRVGFEPTPLEVRRT